jgi:hypothetical protein
VATWRWPGARRARGSLVSGPRVGPSDQRAHAHETKGRRAGIFAMVLESESKGPCHARQAHESARAHWFSLSQNGEHPRAKASRNPGPSHTGPRWGKHMAIRKMLAVTLLFDRAFTFSDSAQCKFHHKPVVTKLESVSGHWDPSGPRAHLQSA